MSALFKSYKTDNEKEVGGVEIPTVANEDGSIVTFIVARMGQSNKAYQKALEVASKPHRRAMQMGTLSNEVADEMLKGLFCQHVLKGWKNVFDEDDKPLPFSTANARKLMDALPDLYNDLRTQSNDASLFLDGVREAEAKN